VNKIGVDGITFLCSQVMYAFSPAMLLRTLVPRDVARCEDSPDCTGVAAGREVDARAYTTDGELWESSSSA
jgi:hypothetical protein